MRTAANVYQHFVDFEEQAASVYLMMASRFSPENPELASLWLDMGIQEKQHAGLLQFCLTERLFAANLPGDKEIHEGHALFLRLMNGASEPDLSVDDSFKIAAELEASEVNTIYDHLTTPAHSSMYLLRRKISSSLPDHVGHVLKTACRFKVSEATIRALEQLAAKSASHELTA